jgi:uncharacterized protein YndB with AHSA1/START domain
MTSANRTLHTRAGEQSLTFTRQFAAPAKLVFRAHVDAELFVRWMGPRGSTIHLECLEPHAGGAFRFHVGDDPAYTFFGSYHEVTEPARIVHTWEMLGDPRRPTLETLMFTDLEPGHCRLDGLSIYTSIEQCTRILAWDESGHGMDENFERLDDLLTQLRSSAS